MRWLLPILLLVLGIAGGGAAAVFLGAPSVETVSAEAETPAEDALAEDPQPRQVGGTSIGRVMPASADTEFVRLNNQFIVPIVRHGNVRSLVVMALTIEVDAGSNGDVFDREPRLRDSFLRVLFAHANSGGFDGSFTEAAAMTPLRVALTEAAAQSLGDIVHEVLIVDITRQDA